MKIASWNLNSLNARKSICWLGSVRGSRRLWRCKKPNSKIIASLAPRSLPLATARCFLGIKSYNGVGAHADTGIAHIKDIRALRELEDQLYAGSADAPWKNPPASASLK